MTMSDDAPDKPTTTPFDLLPTAHRLHSRTDERTA